MCGVFGNNDAEKDLLRQKFESMGHEVSARFVSLEMDDLKVALLHGDEPDLLQFVTKVRSYDLVVFGHTHSVIQSQEGRTTVLNPGEICGYLNGKATIATFDTKTRLIEIIEI